MTDLNVVVLQEWVVLTSAGLHGPGMHLLRTGCYQDYFRVFQTKESFFAGTAQLLSATLFHFPTVSVKSHIQIFSESLTEVKESLIHYKLSESRPGCWSLVST